MKLLNKVVVIMSIFGLILGLSGTPLVYAQSMITPPVYDPRPFGSKLEMHINDDGTVVVQGARVEQLAGQTFYAKIYWNLSFLRLTIRTDEKTTFEKRFGQPIGVSDIAVGDYISVSGTLYQGSNSIDIVAKRVKNWSLQTEEQTFSGVIGTSGTSTPAIILDSKTRGPIILGMGTTTVVSRGNLTVNPDELLPGKKIVSATGVYDHRTNTLALRTIRIFQDMTIFKDRNFQGKLKSLNSTTLPTSAIVTIENRDYTVNIPADAKILNSKKKPFPLARFISGDTVRMYGHIEEVNTSVIDVTILRNLDL